MSGLGLPSRVHLQRFSVAFDLLFHLEWTKLFHVYRPRDPQLLLHATTRIDFILQSKIEGLIQQARPRASSQSRTHTNENSQCVATKILRGSQKVLSSNKRH